MSTDSTSQSVCPVCSYTGFRAEYVCTDFFVTGETFALLKCPHCGFRITDSAPGPTESGKYYHSEKYISHSNIRKGFTNKAYHVVREYMLWQKGKIVHKCFGEKTGSLLDIGAGTGFFLHFMQKRGWKVTGTEKSADARQFALKEWNLSLFPDETLFSLPDHSYDVITLWHVMEHLHNLEEHWEKLSKLLKPSGCLLVALPNSESTDAKHYKEYWAAWDVPRHLRHFSPENIQQMAQNHRFLIKNIFRMPFDAFYVSILSEKYRNSSFPLLKGFFYGMVSWMVSLFRPLKCSSLIYTFHLNKENPD